jgi:hypothetical protein
MRILAGLTLRAPGEQTGGMSRGSLRIYLGPKTSVRDGDG